LDNLVPDGEGAIRVQLPEIPFRIDADNPVVQDPDRHLVGLVQADIHPLVPLNHGQTRDGTQKGSIAWHGHRYIDTSLNDRIRKEYRHGTPKTSI
jgi:hypothetical protein